MPPPRIPSCPAAVMPARGRTGRSAAFRRCCAGRRRHPRATSTCSVGSSGRSQRRATPTSRSSSASASLSRPEAARGRRRAAAERYRPGVIDLLLVAEAPPSALDRYFYFEHVRTHDSLFRHVVEGVLGERPTRDKAPYLDELRERGVFLIDLCEQPFSGRDVLAGCVPGLVRRATRLAPARVVLVGVSVYDAA